MSDQRDEDARGGVAARRNVLIAYFSRAGENYYYGGRRDLKIGNTEVLATMIAKHIAADMYRIRAASPYPHDYEATVARNVREQNADARPRITSPLKSIDSYDVVLLESPIWNVRPPMIISTFAERFDFSGKTISSVRHLRRQRARHDDDYVQGPLHRRRDHRRPRRARRDRKAGRPAGARVAAPHQPPQLAARIENQRTASTCASSWVAVCRRFPKTHLIV